MPIFTPVVAPLMPTSDNAVKDTVVEGSSSNVNDNWEDVVHPTDWAGQDVVGNAKSMTERMRRFQSPAPTRVRIMRSMAQDAVYILIPLLVDARQFS